MTRQIVTIPANFLRHLSYNWEIDWREQSLGDFNDGVTNSMFGGFPRWVGAPSIHLDRQTIGQWRAIKATAQGHYGIYRVRMADPASFVRTATGATSETVCIGQKTADGNTFSNGFGTEYAPIATASGAYAAGAETIRIDTTGANGIAPHVGQIMSHDDWPFLVTWTRDRGSNVWELGVQMPLRAAIADGDVIQLRGVGRFQATESGMGSIGYGAGMLTTASLSFIEVSSR
ncbi:hypothetical protein [Sagittula stellata]|uniref:Uncharacterized protein n=1 Tax=Sagittula stellata (strain ATCC 700073 / DSM 11524 / E-37) TaxID=388399 RepID=A3KA64_SAGS3|nr:hypothetical protein [Sagittula stellata]EBA06007.1 hypothetical protein SSE37_25403 [Sagittula stellata E-37]